MLSVSCSALGGGTEGDGEHDAASREDADVVLTTDGRDTVEWVGVAGAVGGDCW